MTICFLILLIALLGGGAMSQSFAGPGQEFQFQNASVTVEWPLQAVENVREMTKNLPKIDEFSSATDRSQYIQLVRDLAIQPLVFKMPFCSHSYNAENQSFRISLVPRIGESEPGWWNLNLVKNEQTTGTYAAQNAFGASARVEKVLRTEVDIRWQSIRKPPSVGQQPYLVNDYQYVVDVSVPSEQARAEEKDIACLIVFRPTLLYSSKDQGKSAWFPFLVNEVAHTPPTLRSPYDRTIERTVLIGVFEELWIVNERTGKVYARFN